jgi:hypothetical protein
LGGQELAAPVLAAEPGSRETLVPADPLRLEQQRLSVRSDVLDLPANLLAENTPGDLAHWYLPWARQQAAGVEYFAFLEKQLGDTDAAHRQLLSHWQAQRQQWETRLGTAVATQQAELQAAHVAPPATRLAPLTPTPAVAAQLAAADAVDTLEVSLPPLDRGNLWLRLFACLAIAVAVMAAYRFKLQSWLADYLATCPQLAGVLIGVAWWLWLTPSIIGWAIVALSLLSGLRRIPRVSSEDKTRRAKTTKLPLAPLPPRA